IEKDNKYDRAYYYAANIHDRLGQRDKAINLYKRVIELNPNDFYAYNNLGSLYEELGKYEVAKKYLKGSLDLNPNFYKALFNMGVVKSRLKDNERALAYYRKAIETNKKYYYTYLNMAVIYIGEDKYKNAVEILTEGIRNNPSKEDLYYKRASCFTKLGLEDRAIEDIRQVLSLNLDYLDLIKKDKDFYRLSKVKKFKRILKEYNHNK
ncbi:MAG TPA: tetratricopeptide repeat protein, partial [Tissierellaceae bacterium]|nr:tetratricopeptide repeat protein [Tissierellaceae bacterium]